MSNDTPESVDQLKQDLVDNVVSESVDMDGYCDLRSLFRSTNATRAELLDAIDEMLKDLTDEQIVAKLRDPSTLVSQLSSCLRSGALSNQTTFATEALKTTDGENKKLLCSLDTSFRDKSTKGGKFKNELEGQKAALAFTARLRGLKRVYLYNSGFYIDMRPMEMGELNEFFNTVDNNSEELGRMLGGHFFLIHDTFLKEKFMELLPLVVVGSNLKNFDNPDVLSRAVSIQDYEVLLWAVCTMMYKKGIRPSVQCANPDCKHVMKMETCDLNRMRMVDVDNFPEDAVKWMTSETPITSMEDYNTYQNLLGNTDKFMYKNIRFHTKVPSVHDVISYGKSLIANIASKIKAPLSLKNELVTNQIIINYNRMLIPWIAKVEMLNDEGEVEFSSSSIEAYNSILEIDVDDPDTGALLNKFNTYMQSTKISHICYSISKCPMCGKTHSGEVDGLIGLDVQYLFFYLTYRKLPSIGLQ